MLLQLGCLWGGTRGEDVDHISDGIVTSFGKPRTPTQWDCRRHQPVAVDPDRLAEWSLSAPWPGLIQQWNPSPMWGLVIQIYNNKGLLTQNPRI